jgi:cytochrome c oxidase assembly factor CtaG
MDSIDYRLLVGGMIALVGGVVTLVASWRIFRRWFVVHVRMRIRAALRYRPKPAPKYYR